MIFRLILILATLGFPYATFGYDPTEYDRLDGKGNSGVRVDVIEWEGNLEIHAYPRGSIAGLALKVDRAGTPAMVIGYRFTKSPEDQLIRRNILSIDLKDGFVAYLDSKERDYDKIVVSNTKLTGRYTKFTLDPEPKHLFPKDHPDRMAIESQESKKSVAEGAAPSAPTSSNVSAVTGKKQEVSREPVSIKKPAQESAPSEESKPEHGDSNSVKSFSW